MISLNRRVAAGRGLGMILAIAFLMLARVGAQESVVPGMEDSCIENLGYLACENGMPKAPGGGGQRVVLHFAAAALSPTMMTVGASHGQNSLDEADEQALRVCRRNGAKDCKVVAYTTNRCLGLAVSYAERRYGSSGGVYGDRDSAARDALQLCRKTGAKSCFVITAPCANDDPRWSAPMPLPVGVSGGAVDPRMVGTWELFINPGRWVWRVAANGTYEFHSEAMDAAGSNAGTFSASNGHYTLHAVSFQWDDAGTYTVQSPGVVIAKGKLGTGTWRRIKGGGE